MLARFRKPTIPHCAVPHARVVFQGYAWAADGRLTLAPGAKLADRPSKPSAHVSLASVRTQLIWLRRQYKAPAKASGIDLVHQLLDVIEAFS